MIFSSPHRSPLPRLRVYSSQNNQPPTILFNFFSSPHQNQPPPPSSDFSLLLSPFTAVSSPQIRPTPTDLKPLHQRRSSPKSPSKTASPPPTSKRAELFSDPQSTLHLGGAPLSHQQRRPQTPIGPFLRLNIDSKPISTVASIAGRTTAAATTTATPLQRRPIWYPKQRRRRRNP